MKILIINASPRPAGMISRLLGIIGQELKSHGAEVTDVSVSKMTVSPCRGCMSCRVSLRCALPADDAQSLLSMITQADAVVIGSPCYWGNIPGQLKLALDRIVYGMMGESSLDIPTPLHRGKRLAIVATSTTRWPWNRLFHQTSGVVRSLKEIFGWSGFKLVGTLQRGDTKRKPLSDRDMDKARRLARKLAR